MKKLLSLLFLMGIFVTGFSQWQGGPRRQNDQQNSYDSRQSNALVINTDAQKDFTVVIDNGAQYMSNGNTVTVNSLYNGSHTITIYERRNNLWGKQKQREIYSSTIYLKPGIETSVYINGYNQVKITERQLYNYNNGNDGDDCDDRKFKKNKKHHGHNNRYDNNDRGGNNRDDRWNK